MKIRKEYLIFGGVIIALVALITIPNLMSGRVHYNSDNVVVNFGRDGADTDVAVTTPASSFDTVEEQLQVGDFTGANVDDVDTEVELTGDIGESVGHYDPSNVTSDEPYIDEKALNGDPGAAGLIGDAPVVVNTPDYATAVLHFVCSSSDFESYSGLFTDRLALAFGTFTDEPFAVLNGNTVFEDVVTESNIVTFKAGNEMVYSFSYTLEGDKIASINFVE